jgi:hypothetical protein
LGNIIGLNQREPTDDIFGFGKGAIDYAFGTRLNQLAGPFKGLAPVHHVAPFGKTLEPGLPFLQDLLLLFWR